MIKNKKILFSIIIFLFIIGIINCEKEILKNRIFDSTPEFVQIPEILKVSYSTAEISWSVNVPCTTYIKYWISDNNDTNQINYNNEFRQNHLALLYGLEDNTTYDFQIFCYNKYNYSNYTDVLSFSTTVNYLDYISKGWSNFQEDDLDSAIYYFQQYLEVEPDKFDAQLGSGWSYCKKGRLDLAHNYFYQCLITQSQNDDVNSGNALNLYKQSLFGDVIPFAKRIHNKVINYWADNYENYNPLDSAFYIFEYDSSFDNLDIALMLADSYCKTLNYDDSKTVINFLYPSVKVHPLLPNSWVVDTNDYESYENALGALIDSLKSEFWINGKFPQ